MELLAPLLGVLGLIGGLATGAALLALPRGRKRHIGWLFIGGGVAAGGLGALSLLPVWPQGGGGNAMRAFAGVCDGSVETIDMWPSGVLEQVYAGPDEARASAPTAAGFGNFSHWSVTEGGDHQTEIDFDHVIPPPDALEGSPAKPASYGGAYRRRLGGGICFNDDTDAVWRPTGAPLPPPALIPAYLGGSARCRRAAPEK